MGESQLTIIFTEQSLLLSTEAWRDWQAVQASFPDYVASLEPDTTEGVLEYFAHDYSPDDQPFDHELVKTFVQSSHGDRLWASGSVCNIDGSPLALKVRDVFDITGMGITLGFDRNLPLESPLGDHQVRVKLRGGYPTAHLVRLQLVHFNPTGYQVVVTAPYSTSKRNWTNASIAFN